MKRLYVLILSIALSFLTLSIFDLKSFAYDSDFNYPTAGVTISYSFTRNSDNCDVGIEYESIYPIVFAYDQSGYIPITPLAYGRMRSRYSIYNSGEWGNWNSISWQSWTMTIDGVQTTMYKGSDYLPYNNPNISNLSTSNCIIFNSIESAYEYFLDPENSDNLDNVVNEQGSDILQGSIIPDVDWGSGGIPYYDGSVPSKSIPAPKFVVSGGQSGNVKKTVTFTNFEYDSRAQDGKYGIVLYMKWSSLDDFYLAHTGGVFEDTFKVTYGSTLPWGDYVFVYDVPEKENQINYCPQSFSFDSNSACVTGFEHYLQNYPISSRTIDGPTEFNSLTGVGPIESFEEYLSKPSCPYNTLIFNCYYYRKMPDGHFEFGPSSTGTFYPPSQNAIFNTNSKTSNDMGSMNSGYGGGASGESDNNGYGDKWHQNWGDNTPDINYGQNVDPQALVENISDLFGLIGQMPSFMGQLFVFLPTWLINFISVAIALSIAIGVVKLFIG